jgi:hypothetical protein
MAKILLIFLVLKLLLIPACNKKHNEELNTLKQANIYFKGTYLLLTHDEVNSIIKQTDNALAEGQTLNSLAVTSEMIQQVKEKEQFLEITFHENRFVMTDKSGKIEFRQVMIPLTGRFAQPGSLTIFYGTTGYHDSPLICSNGYNELRELLIGMEY